MFSNRNITRTRVQTTQQIITLKHDTKPKPDSLHRLRTYAQSQGYDNRFVTAVVNGTTRRKYTAPMADTTFGLLCNFKIAPIYCDFHISFVTHAVDSRVSIAFIGICLCASVCLCECLHDRTKTAGTEITKLATGIAHHESWLPV